MIRKASLVLIAFLLVSVAPMAQSTASYTFQTVLLVGSVEGQSDLDRIPSNVSAALDDVTQFLPFKSYRLIEASILRSSRDASSLLNGPSGRDFELKFRFQEGQDGTLVVDTFAIDTLVAEPRERTITEGGKSRIEHQPPSWVRRNVIRTSFTVTVGETIVVGSSKLNGSGEGLIVLFTAMR